MNPRGENFQTRPSKFECSNGREKERASRESKSQRTIITGVAREEREKKGPKFHGLGSRPEREVVKKLHLFSFFFFHSDKGPPVAT